MSDLDDEQSANGGPTSDQLDDLPIPVWQDYARAVILTGNRVDALVRDSRQRHEQVLETIARMQADVTVRLDTIEGGVLELVADNRARKSEIDQVRETASVGFAELRAGLARQSRISAVDEQERQVVVDLARTGAEAARAHLALSRVDAQDALVARRERRALVVAGVKKFAALVGVPILTAAATAAALLIAKGC